MKIELAKTAGFCFGVKRAVDTVWKKVNEGKKVYTYGPIVHNDLVVGELEKKGVAVVNSPDELDEIKTGLIIIRAHGVPRNILQKLETMKNQEIDYVDATCPFVKKIHRIVEEEGRKGRHVIIIGDPEHPEIKGIMGWCTGPYSVLFTENDVTEFTPDVNTSYSIVAQTTFNHKKFQVFVEILQQKSYNNCVYDTICNATDERQAEAAEIARRNDAVIVIGGKQSSNTQKLFEICKQECANTYYIEQPNDPDLNRLRSFYSVGITAGASTPNNIITEVLTNMSETSFEELLEESLVTIHNGEVVKGTVIRVKEDEIALNIGYKADGIITKSEFTNDSSADLRTLVKEGDELQVKVLKVNDGDGQVQLTYKRLAAERGNKRLEEAFKSKEVLTATVTEILKGGLSVEVEGTRVFIPASLVSEGYEKNLEKYKDQTIEFVISEFVPQKRRIIGDRKVLLVAKKKELQEELFSKINVGDIITGTIKNVTDFGIFIDLGGADGLVHISELSWGRTENPKKTYKAGDEVRAFIKEISGEKIALSMKFPNENPWADADEKYVKGMVVKGKVARMADFGAFVELATGVDALLHVSQISKERIEKPSAVLKIGQEIEAMIVDVNYDEKKISLSMKALLPEEEVAEETPAEAPADAE